MNADNYWTDGKRVVHPQERYAFGDWQVLVWDDAVSASKRHLLTPAELTVFLIGHRKLTPAEVRQWVAGGPVPGREEP